MKAYSKVNTEGKPLKAAIDPRWSWHYRTLSRLRDDLARQCGEKLRDVAGQTIEPHTVHPADSATDEYDHELSLTLLTGQQNGLNEVDAAIRRIEEGRYGVCEASGQPIPRARLQAVPWTRYTAEVEAGMELAGRVPVPRLAATQPLRREGFQPPEAVAEEPGEEAEADEVQPPQFLEFAVKKTKELEEADPRILPRHRK
jgi:DnaK suppressor protein